MAFVYRWIDQEGRIAYIGIVKSDAFPDLMRRVSQHEFAWAGRWQNYEIDFIPCLTIADAEALETILTARYHPYRAKAKSGWGGTFAFDLSAVEKCWMNYLCTLSRFNDPYAELVVWPSPPVPVLNRLCPSTPVYEPLAFGPHLFCPYCGQEIPVRFSFIFHDEETEV